MTGWKKCWILFLPLLLSGCMMSASAESLYALPQLPEEYGALSAQLAEILSSGAEYAPPQSGRNLPPVQKVDLDGDGSDEVLAFFRISSEERSPLKIYIFRAVEDGYQLAGRIDGSGTSIHSFLYEDMNGDGIQELVVSWSVSAEVQAMSVYMLEDLEPVQVMSTSYARYTLADMDSDDDQELVVLRSDDAETGFCLADYYDWGGGNSSLQLQSTAKLSVSVAALQWVQVGALRGGKPAVFVTSRLADTNETITDILVYRQGGLENVVLSSDTAVSTQISPATNLQPWDINDDGATEVPMPEPLPSEGGGEAYWKIYWHSYGADGAGQVQALTYHNLTDKWFLIIPPEWDGRFAVRQNNISSSVHATTFYSVLGRAVGEELMTIYTFTGTDREAQAAKGGRTILRRRAGLDTVYAVTFSSAYENWNYAVSQDVISESFKLIVNQWSMGEN